VIADADEVAMPLAVGYLVDPDATKAVQAVAGPSGGVLF
jgi:hypothetical protein